MRKFQWENDPKIGFWIENDPVRLYVGTPFSPDIIAKTGIVAPRKRWVSAMLDPYTAQSRVGDGFVIILEVPLNWLFARMDQRLGDNTKKEIDRLLIKEIYLKWTLPDSQYYANTEIRVANHIPARYIIGYTEKRQNDRIYSRLFKGTRTTG